MCSSKHYGSGNGEDDEEDDRVDDGDEDRTTKTMRKDDRTKTMQKNKRIREWMRGPEWIRRMDERFIPQTLNIGFLYALGKGVGGWGQGWVGFGMDHKAK